MMQFELCFPEPVPGATSAGPVVRARPVRLACEAPRLRTLFTAEDVEAISEALDLDAARMLRDPVRMLPRVASCDMGRARRFLRLVLVGRVPELCEMESEDAAALYVSNVFVHFAARVREQMGGRLRA